MELNAMRPFGLALLAYARGDTQVDVVVRRDDGLAVALPMAFFFRSPEAFSDVERTALEACRGRVLDAGAGSGLHTRCLQDRGFTVTAIDVSPEAVQVMRERGVTDPRRAELFEFRGSYDTCLLLGHGAGMAGDLAGLDRLLSRAPAFLAPGGQLLLNSLDVGCTDDPVHLAYQEANRVAGRYPGEIRQQVVFGEVQGPVFKWLHVDPDTLEGRSRASGWNCEILTRDQHTGDYLARLERRRGA